MDANSEEVLVVVSVGEESVKLSFKLRNAILKMCSFIMEQLKRYETLHQELVQPKKLLNLFPRGALREYYTKKYG